MADEEETTSLIQELKAIKATVEDMAKDLKKIRRSILQEE